MKCDDCIHKEVCKNYPNEGLPKSVRARKLMQGCEHFTELGKMIKLPCKVEDTVWYVRECTMPNCQQCGGYKRVDNCVCKSKARLFKIPFSIELINKIGKTVFLTKADAQAELARLEGKK